MNINVRQILQQGEGISVEFKKATRKFPESLGSAVPHYKVDALLRRVDTDRYDDRENIRCNLVEAYDRLMAFVAKHLPDKFYLQGDQRISLREKIVFQEEDIFVQRVPLDEKVIYNGVDQIADSNLAGKVTGNNTENNTENISKSQKIIIKEIKRNPHLTSEELSTIVGITADNIRVNLAKLKARGLVERIGPDKGGYWKILK